MMYIFLYSQHNNVKYVFYGVTYMMRSKDFKMMDVYYDSGRYAGFINDILIDFAENSVVGFSAICSSFTAKTVNILFPDIICYSSNMIISKTSRADFLKLSSIKNMNIIGKNGNMIGTFEDVLFDEKSFKIKGAVVSSGYIYNFLKGKRVMLVKDLLIGDKNILFFGNADRIEFLSKPHRLSMEDDYDDKQKKVR